MDALFEERARDMRPYEARTTGNEYVLQCSSLVLLARLSEAHEAVTMQHKAGCPLAPYVRGPARARRTKARMASRLCRGVDLVETVNSPMAWSVARPRRCVTGLAIF